MNDSNPSTPASPGKLSHEIADAANELTCRINLGEFDDLDDTQMSELRTLAALMSQWAQYTQALEQRLNLAPSPSDPPEGRGIAYCN